MSSSSVMRSSLVRLLALIGGWAWSFWVAGIVWDALVGEPNGAVLVVVTGSVVAGLLWWRIRVAPNALAVPSTVSWIALAGRLIANAVLLYPLLAVATAFVAGAILYAAHGASLPRDGSEAVLLLASWLSIWGLPFATATATGAQLRRAAERRRR